MTVFLVHVSNRRKEPSDLHSSGAGSTNTAVGTTVPGTTKACEKMEMFKTWPCLQFIVWPHLLAGHFHVWRNYYSCFPSRFLCFHCSHWKPLETRQCLWSTRVMFYCICWDRDATPHPPVYGSLSESFILPSCLVNKWTCHGNVNEGHLCHHHTKLHERLHDCATVALIRMQ